MDFLETRAHILFWVVLCAVSFDSTTRHRFTDDAEFSFGADLCVGFNDTVSSLPIRISGDVVNGTSMHSCVQPN